MKSVKGIFFSLFLIIFNPYILHGCKMSLQGKNRFGHALQQNIRKQASKQINKQTNN